MNFSLSTYVSLCLVIIFSTLCNPSEATQLKRPPNPRPLPEELTLPAPFEEWDECDLLSKVYSAFNCETGLIGKKINEAESENGDRIAEVNKVSLWKVGGKKKLLVLIETRFAQPYESGSTGKSVDLALFDRINDKLSLVAFADGVIGYREFGSSKLDLAPYKLNSKETAIGVRWSSGIGGVGEEFLDLFRLDKNTFRTVFSREMWFEKYSNGGASILQVIQNSSGMNDLMIITNTYLLDDVGNKVKTSTTRTEELWRWNNQSQTYKLMK